MSDSQERERCPTCDDPIAHRDHSADDCTGDRCWCHDVCWGGDECQELAVDWRARALAAEQERDDARRGIEELEGRLRDFLGVQSGEFGVKDSRAFMTVRSNAVQWFAEAYWDVVKDAPNYIEAKFTCGDGAGTVTIQRCDGKTPHELRLAEEQRARDAEALHRICVESYARKVETAWGALCRIAIDEMAPGDAARVREAMGALGTRMAGEDE